MHLTMHVLVVSMQEQYVDVGNTCHLLHAVLFLRNHGCTLNPQACSCLRRTAAFLVDSIIWAIHAT